MSEITDTLETAVDNPVSGIDQSNGNFKYDMTYDFDAGTGLNERTVDYISSVKKEAPWIHEFRQNALKRLDDLGRQLTGKPFSQGRPPAAAGEETRPQPSPQLCPHPSPLPEGEGTNGGPHGSSS